MTQSDTKLNQNPITESIKNYLSMKTSGALLVTGEWGSGKTYYFKNELFKEIEEEEKEENKYIPIIVSLFGLTDIKEIPERVLYEFLDKSGSNGFNFGKAAKIVKSFIEAVPKINDYVDINKLIGSGHGLYRTLPENILICFDDVERVAEDIKLNDLLGLINELVENRKYKVIIIANEDFIEQSELVFKEKVIEKTLRFTPDMLSIFSTLVSSHNNDCFSEFMQQDFVKSSLIPYHKSKITSDDLQKNLSNIRLIKFAIEHFYPVFKKYAGEKTIIDEFDKITLIKLENFWTFILAISIESKINNITYDDRRGIDTYEPVLALHFVDFGDEDKEEFNFNADEQEEEEQKSIKEKAENDQKYSKRFYNKYFSRLSQRYVFHNELYNYITSGISIDFYALDSHANKKLNIAKDEINPAHILLDQFMTNPWKFTNEEAQANLKTLFDYVGEGLLDDYLSYINASTQLIIFRELIEKSEEEIICQTKNGIGIFNDKVDDVIINDRTDIEMTHDYLLDKVIPVYDFVIKSIDKKTNDCIEREKENIQVLFDEDLEKLHFKFLPNSKYFVSDYFGIPILANITQESIKNKIKKIEPKDVVCLNSLIEERYIKSSISKNIKVELTFLNNINTYTKEVENDKTMSSIYIKRFLSPNLTKAIAKLNYL